MSDMKKGQNPQEYSEQLQALKGKLNSVDILFKSLEENPALPTFSEFFVSCIMMGQSECVNLKALFPAVHRDVSDWMSRNYS